ncbi:hypothetical protein K2173_010721 [Erythroxylum novogranatense]|uniref:Transmembrane protein n=1 Tax=Erythroxylum novogranatense TaxID=1862640 RepID=A0AAV8SQW4_9ROSI|nr:hypothetical protein K2173_010721 [Erythroxylum novogranatense]
MAPGKCGSGGGLVGDESGLKYAKIEGKDGGFIPRLFLGLPDKESILKQPKKNKQSFKRVLKAVLFETSLAKKIKRTKVLQKLHQSKKNRSGRVEKKNSYQVKNNPTNSIYLEVPRKVDGTNTSQSSSRNISRSSSYSSISKSLVKTKPSNLAQPNQKQDNYLQDIGQGGQSNDIGIYVIVVSLLALAFCSKTTAIIFTVGCLYCSASGVDLHGNMKSKQYKKKIIMEAPLGRNRGRGV